MRGSVATVASAGPAKLAEAPLDVAAVFDFNGSQTGVKQLAPGDDNDIKTRRNLVTTENLSNQAFRSISLNRATQAPGSGDPQPANRQLVRQNEQSGEAAVNPGAPLVDLLKLGATADVLVSPEISHVSRNLPESPYALTRERVDLSRPAHSLLTVRRLRPFERRRLRTSRPFFVLMRTRNPCVRLRWRVLGWNVRFPFMLGLSLRSENEPPMLANAFGRCQSKVGMQRCQWRVVCVKVCVLQEFLRRPRQKFFADPGRFFRRRWQEFFAGPGRNWDVRLVSSQSFPHLWKKLWKLQ
jgi:hypothetical protein